MPTNNKAQRANWDKGRAIGAARWTFHSMGSVASLDVLSDQARHYAITIRDLASLLEAELRKKSK